MVGFRCQSFKQAGLKNGFRDIGGALFFNIEQIIKHKKTRVFLLENAKHLKDYDKGGTFSIIIGSLGKLGYKAYRVVLNAKDFGLPQNRESLFIVGFLDRGIDFNFPIPKNEQVFVGDIITDDFDKKYIISDRL